MNLTPRKAALTLVTGPTPAAREAAIVARLGEGVHGAMPAGAQLAVLLEGLPDGRSLLLDSPLVDSAQLNVQRIAPGCLCCTGNLVLRVTLNRILRRQPDRLFIGLATTEHLDQLRSWLQAPPYDQLLELTADLVSHVPELPGVIGIDGT